MRYQDTHYAADEGVYNSPEIDKSKVIWAREMDKWSNEELIRYYNGRQVWLVQPDVGGGDMLQPYPGLEKSSSRELARVYKSSPVNAGAPVRWP